MLYRHAQAFMAKQLKPYNIGSGQYTFLYILYKHNGIIQESLTDILEIDKATTARAVAKLEKEGYVKRVTDPDDKRAFRIFITDKTLATIPFIRKAMLEWNEMVTTGLNEQDKATALKLLQKMALNSIKIKENKLITAKYFNQIPKL